MTTTRIFPRPYARTFPEIAEATGYSLRTVKSDFARGMRKLEALRKGGAR